MPLELAQHARGLEDDCLRSPVISGMGMGVDVDVDLAEHEVRLTLPVATIDGIISLPICRRFVFDNNAGSPILSIIYFGKWLAFRYDVIKPIWILHRITNFPMCSLLA